MTKKKLIEDIKRNPARYYRAPSDVNRDRRFSNEERLQILEAWERDARGVPNADSAEAGTSELRQIFDARAEVEKRMPSAQPMPPSQSDSHPKLGSADH